MCMRCGLFPSQLIITYLFTEIYFFISVETFLFFTKYDYDQTKHVSIYKTVHLFITQLGK